MSASEAELAAALEVAKDQEGADDSGEEVVDRGDSLEPTDKNVEEDTGDEVEETTDTTASDEEADDEETDADADEDTSEDEVPAGKTVPWSRFRSQNLQLREAQQKLAEAEAALEANKTAPEPKTEDKPAARDFDAEAAEAEAKMAAALEDNDATAVLAANRELLAIERARNDMRFEELRNEDKNTQTLLADRAFNEALDLVEAELPQIDPNSDEFDAIKQTLVQDLVRSYEQQGYASDDALLKAAAMAFPESEFGQNLLNTASKETKPAATKKSAPKARSIKDKLEAAKSTPPNINKAGGASSDKAGMTSEVNVADLSDEEFAALPEHTKARLRGDTVAA